MPKKAAASVKPNNGSKEVIESGNQEISDNEPSAEIPSSDVQQAETTKKSSLFSDSNKARFSKISTQNAEGSETVTSKTPVVKSTKKKPVNKHEFDEYTIFVGNLPTSVIQKPTVVRKQFSKFGTIKSIRFRSVGVESTPISYFNKKLLKKVAVIKNNLSDEKKSVNAYIVYDSKDSVEAALSLNNNVFLDRHIVVDRVTPTKQLDKSKNKRTLFIGNLPFAADEEELRDFFETELRRQKTNIDENHQEFVESVRIVRTKDTQKGKGFGYVVLKDAVEMPLALLMDKKEFKGRALRVSRYLQSEEAIEKKKLRDAMVNGRMKGRKEKGGKGRKGGKAEKVETEKKKKGKEEKKESKEQKTGDNKKEKKEKKVKKEKTQGEPKGKANKKGDVSSNKPSVDLSFMGEKAKLNSLILKTQKKLAKKAKK